jgi:hypothetical protein
MAATLDRPYCSLEDVKNVLRRVTDSSKDELLRDAINYASRLIDSITGRIFYKLEWTDYYLSANGNHKVLGDTIILSTYPIISISALSEDGTALVENTDYFVDYESGIITKAEDADWETDPRAIKISGFVGYATADDLTPAVTQPGDIRLACIDIAKRKSGLFHKELQAIDGTTGEVEDESVPQRILTDLKRYRRRMF